MATTAGYGEGERVFGPPQGSYDADWVANSARSADPGLPEATALELATYAWDHLRSMGEVDASELARRLLSDHQQAGASASTVVAKAAADFVVAYEVPLG